MSNGGKIKIGEHIRIIPGFPFNSRLFNTNGEGVPLIRIRDLLKSKIETFYNGEYSYDFVISEGDILIGMDGDFHIVKWNNKKKALLNQRIMKVAQKEGALIDINYFYYFLFPLLQKVWDRTTATTVKHLSTYDISDAFEIFPSISEQRQIATILSTADAVIEKTQAAIAKYKAIKQGMLQDLFTRGINTTTGKLRPAYQDAPHLYKESKQGWIPNEWVNIPKLGDHINILSGYPFNSRLFNSEGVGLPLIRIRDLQKSKIETFFSGEYQIEYLISEGDILIGMDGDFHIVKWNNKKTALLNQRIMKVSQKPNSLININYFYFFLFPFLKEIWESTTATTVKHLSTYDISDAHLQFPPIVEQELIAQRLNSINRKLQSEQTYLQKQLQIKAGLMNDLLSRKKKVTFKEKEMV